MRSQTRTVMRVNPQREALTVNYQDVLEQAVANERFRVINELRAALREINTTQPIPGRSFGTEKRNPETVKAEVEAAIDRIEGALR